MLTRPLDPDKIDLIISCTHCKALLWRMKILSRMGDQVASSEYKPLSPDIPEFSDKRTDCPKCGKQFFKVEKGLHVYRMIDPLTGRELLI
jgi:Zn finger protein HypA/HybF involved in hydrogenase expression